MNGASDSGLDGVAASHVVIYDGDCAMCNGVVRWIMDRDRQRAFVFARRTAGWVEAELARRGAMEAPDSVLVMTRDSLDWESRAVLKILRGLGGWMSAVGFILGLVPLSLRDFGYRLVARHRARLSQLVFKRACRMMGPSERVRMFDGDVAPLWLQPPGNRLFRELEPVA